VEQLMNILMNNLYWEKYTSKT